MKRNSEIEHKYLVALKELKSILNYTSRLSITEFARKNNLNDRLGHVLKSGGIIKTEGSGAYTKNYWVTKVEPNIEMSRKVLDELNKIKSPYNINKNKTTRTTRKKTYVEGHENYKKALEDLKKVTKHPTALSCVSFAKKWGVNSNFIRGCVNSNIISGVHHRGRLYTYTWIGGDITDEMVASVKASLYPAYVYEKQTEQKNVRTTTPTKNNSKTVVKSYLWGMFKKVVTLE